MVTMNNTAKKKTAIPPPNPAEGWQPIAFADVVQRTQFDPPATRWKWTRTKHGGKQVLALRDEKGALHQFKLQRGAWIRPIASELNENDCPT
jgi:hypothetical protein